MVKLIKKLSIDSIQLTEIDELCGEETKNEHFLTEFARVFDESLEMGNQKR